MKACEAGGLDAVPMACNARICNLAAPFHQCLAHRLPGLHYIRRAGERISPERLAGCTPDQKSGLQDTWRQSPFLVRHRESGRHGVSAFLRGVSASFFARAEIPTHCEKQVQAGGPEDRTADTQPTRRHTTTGHRQHRTTPRTPGNPHSQKLSSPGEGP